MSSCTPDFLVVIPARYASTRLPGKPLLELGGWPMLRHTWQAVQHSQARDSIIATDDERILQAAQGFGARALLTSTRHCSGMERVAETVARLEEPDERIVVNVQGDEPLLPAPLIDRVAALLHSDSSADMATLCCRDAELAEASPHRVKVVMDAAGRVLYFSRAQIPWAGQQHGLLRRHIGIYAYRAGYLRQLSRLPSPPLEQAENLEQLRALYHGGRILITEVDAPPPGVDTRADLQAAQRRLEQGLNAGGR